MGHFGMVGSVRALPRMPMWFLGQFWAHQFGLAPPKPFQATHRLGPTHQFSATPPPLTLPPPNPAPKPPPPHLQRPKASKAQAFTATAAPPPPQTTHGVPSVGVLADFWRFSCSSGQSANSWFSFFNFPGRFSFPAHSRPFPPRSRPIPTPFPPIPAPFPPHSRPFPPRSRPVPALFLAGPLETKVDTLYLKNRTPSTKMLQVKHLF